ncbi:hypothetical protein B0A48_05168 [Cryoendolithus antarcticus]|uniref:Phytocyanin domain-containing protein n=1 Tax=Cryoendolithus antarcticus TaxID=1507870 RepID=A0A1V8TER1_9PEZI|nr:hypothetical protein B0A48_05168 [Cryoendolithus antarcticus]
MPSLSRLLAGLVSLAVLGYAEMQIIKAGGNGDHDLEFHPDSITAAVGSQVQFEWYPMNHSLASSTYDNVCEPDGKIFSGYFDPASGMMDKQTFVINITSTEPIWYYCTQEYYTHCQNGMVGVINPPRSLPVNEWAADTCTRQEQPQGRVAARRYPSISTTAWWNRKETIMEAV